MPRAGGYSSDQDRQGRERDTEQGNEGASLLVASSVEETQQGNEVETKSWGVGCSRLSGH